MPATEPLPSFADDFPRFVEELDQRLSGLGRRLAALAVGLDESKPTSGAGTGAGHLLFVPSSAGYRLVGAEGQAPRPGTMLDVSGLEGAWFTVVKVGSSPLPGDGRRCAYLESES